MCSVRYSASFGAGRQVGEQDKLESLVCNFAKLGGCKLLQIKIQELMTKPDWDT